MTINLIFLITSFVLWAVYKQLNNLYFAGKLKHNSFWYHVWLNGIVIVPIYVLIWILVNFVQFLVWIF